MRNFDSEHILILTAGAVVISLAAILNVNKDREELSAPPQRTEFFQEMRENLTQLEHRIETLENLDLNRPRTESGFQWLHPAGQMQVTQMTR